MELPSDLDSLHNEIIEYGSTVQKASAVKKEKEDHIGDNLFQAFSKIDAFGITLHRAVKTLCVGGWTHISPLLLRSIMECSVNRIAIINSEDSEYMAFKYLFIPFIKAIRDDKYPSEIKTNIIEAVEKGILSIKDSQTIIRARKYIDKKVLPNYWFQPEHNSISSIIKKYAGEEMQFGYGALSMTTHGYHIGIELFKDDPDQVSIEPMENPKKLRNVILLSCRHLLELLIIRNNYERLGLGTEYKRLSKKTNSFILKG